jgi:hypothetical protein
MYKTSSMLGLAAGALLLGFGLGGGAQAATINSPLLAHPVTPDAATVTPAAYRCWWRRTYYGPRRVCRWVPGPYWRPRPYWGPPPPRFFPPPPPRPFWGPPRPF